MGAGRDRRRVMRTTVNVRMAVAFIRMMAGSNSEGVLVRKTAGKVVKDEQGALKVAGLLQNEPGAL
jgi:hypothetical protein